MPRVRAEFPLYLLVSRKGPQQLPAAVPARADVLDGRQSRSALLAYRQRATAAAWIEREGRYLKPYPMRSVDALDRLAAVALVVHGCRWVALEPALRGLTTECFIDLAEWLADRQPWSQTLYGFCRLHELDLELPRVVAEFAA